MAKVVPMVVHGRPPAIGANVHQWQAICFNKNYHLIIRPLTLGLIAWCPFFWVYPSGSEFFTQISSLQANILESFISKMFACSELIWAKNAGLYVDTGLYVDIYL